MRGRHSFFISGIPKGYNWKKLKDLARGLGVDPQWTDLEPSHYEKDRLMGYTSVKDATAAQKLYGYFTNQKSTGVNLRVHYWDTPQSPELGKARLVRCNCQDLGNDCVVNSPPSIATNSYATRRPSIPPPTGAYFGGVQGAAPPTDPPYAPQTVPVPSSSSTSNLTHEYYYQSPGVYPSTLQPQNGLGQLGGSGYPSHVQSTDGTPVNISRGAYRTEARAIFISNLPFDVEKPELEDLLRTLGTLVNCQVRPHKRKQGCTQGTASAEFATRVEACHARDSLDGYEWNGRRITVRLDRETTKSSSINEGEPIVVNGSGRN